MVVRSDAGDRWEGVTSPMATIDPIWSLESAVCQRQLAGLQQSFTWRDAFCKYPVVANGLARFVGYPLRLRRTIFAGGGAEAEGKCLGKILVPTNSMPC